MSSTLWEMAKWPFFWMLHTLWLDLCKCYVLAGQAIYAVYCLAVFLFIFYMIALTISTILTCLYDFAGAFVDDVAVTVQPRGNRAHPPTTYSGQRPASAGKNEAPRWDDENQRRKRN